MISDDDSDDDDDDSVTFLATAFPAWLGSGTLISPWSRPEVQKLGPCRTREPGGNRHYVYREVCQAKRVGFKVPQEHFSFAYNILQLTKMLACGKCQFNGCQHISEPTVPKQTEG